MSLTAKAVLLDMELRRKASPKISTTRLQPSEPLHMTTRAASKAGSTTSGSRRGSFVSNGHTSPSVSHEGDNERHSKRRKLSIGSKTTPVKASQSSQSTSTGSRPSTRSMSGNNLPPIAESPLLSRKRKRSSASGSTADNILVTVDEPVLNSHERPHSDTSSEVRRQSERNAKRSSTSSVGSRRSLRSNDSAAGNAQPSTDKSEEANEYEGEAAELGSSHEGQSESEKVDGNGASISSQHANDGRLEAAAVSLETDAKPSSSLEEPNGKLEQSRPDSDAFRESDDIVDGSAELNADQDIDEEEDELVEGEVADDDVEDDEEEDDNDEVDQQDIHATQETGTLVNPTPAGSALPSPVGSPPDSSFDQDSPIKRALASLPGDVDTDTVKTKKKMPGRRRAPHSNPKVEAALRRQLHLRMNYRAVAKTLKPILAELAHRSLRQIEQSKTAHEDSKEYADVKEGLHQHFESRLAWIQKHKELSKQRLNDMLEAELEMRKTQYEV